MSDKQHGECALTGAHGKYVKSHILPKSLTKPATTGAPLLQSTFGDGLKRRFSSWYDPNLVIRKGEDILAEADSRGIAELRRLGLLWSSKNYPPQPVRNLGNGLSLLEIREISFERIWLFFAACAWRASVSKLPDMGNFNVSPETENLISEALKEGSAKFHDLPISLILLTTKGEVHNHSPTIDFMPVPSLDKDQSDEIAIIARIYLDGLIGHIHLNCHERNNKPSGPLFLGFEDRLIVLGREMEGSAQLERTLAALNASFESSETDGKVSQDEHNYTHSRSET